MCLVSMEQKCINISNAYRLLIARVVNYEHLHLSANGDFFFGKTNFGHCTIVSFWCRFTSTNYGKTNILIGKDYSRVKYHKWARWSSHIVYNSWVLYYKFCTLKCCMQWLEKVLYKQWRFYSKSAILAQIYDMFSLKLKFIIQ